MSEVAKTSRKHEPKAPEPDPEAALAKVLGLTDAELAKLREDTRRQWPPVPEETR
jgi:hypothetical protein